MMKHDPGTDPDDRIFAMNLDARIVEQSERQRDLAVKSRVRVLRSFHPAVNLVPSEIGNVEAGSLGWPNDLLSSICVLVKDPDFVLVGNRKNHLPSRREGGSGLLFSQVEGSNVRHIGSGVHDGVLQIRLLVAVLVIVIAENDGALLA